MSNYDKVKQSKSNDFFVSKLAEYWTTYDRQHGYENFGKHTLIDDALYAIGIALSDEYQFANGYRTFLADLGVTDTRAAVPVVMLKGLLKAADGMAGDRARHEKANAYDFLVEQLQHHIDQARGGSHAVD